VYLSLSDYFRLFQIDSQYYKAYKKIYAIVLQAVYDASVKFTNCFAGFTGSVGDLRECL